ncbi:MAG: hypothetical protein ACJA1A_002990 [Saprospiraceae bacterium]|jgi:hypothetical protein|tara:strand:+ start:80 stop:1240 length:1161 start_codon:yes stop_codon:yes gene_type:complete
MIENIHFYQRLKKQNKGLVELLSHEESFSHVPDDWYVFVVDIENSTLAVEGGFHEDVNLSAAGSIVAVLNEIKKTDKEIKIPYFFGGDGTTFIIPSKFQKQIFSLLENYRHHVQLTTSLILRVGCVEVSEIYKLNHKIKIARFVLTKHLTVPIVLGTGLKHAEKVIKSSFVDTKQKIEKFEPVNLDGMTCRWKEIGPREQEKKIVCLLAYCSEDQNQADVYKSVVGEIDRIFGDYKARNPISKSKLQLELSFRKIREELKITKGAYSLLTLVINWIGSVFANLHFKLFKEKIEYLKNIPTSSDTMMIDGAINTVFSGTQAKIDQFIEFIDELESVGKLNYGIHVTHSSIMSCYVESQKNNHIHFVDGTEGGYTRAAMMYKSKIIKT